MSTTPEDPFEQRPEDVPAAPPQQPVAPQPEQPYANQPQQPYVQPHPPYAVPPTPGQSPQQGTPQYAQPGYAQPQYSQPYAGQQQYMAAPSGALPGKEKNWMGTTSLILSLLGLVTGITAIAGIVFGHLSLGAVKRGEADNRGQGLAGLIIGYVLAVLGILATIAFFVFIGWIANECGGSNPADWCGADATYTWSA